MANKQSDAAPESVEAESMLGHYLVVRHAFGAYRKGDAIRDEATIRQVLASKENALNVHKVLG